MKIGFLASHGGSNMQAVIDAIRDGSLAMRPSVIISNNRSALAIERAKAEAIPHAVLNAATHPDPDALDTAILSALEHSGTDLVLLAGYMKNSAPRCSGISAAVS